MGRVEITAVEDQQDADAMSEEQQVAFESKWAERASATSSATEVVAVPPQTTAAETTRGERREQETSDAGKGAGVEPQRDTEAKAAHRKSHRQWDRTKRDWEGLQERSRGTHTTMGSKPSKSSRH